MNIDDLDSETLKRLGLKKPRTKTFTAENERSFSIKVLNVIADLKQSERNRVLKRATAMNSK
tara:strand:- start:227 stop:412 length:186 start_codon:yes stop_codon:yes gene_type:complete